VSSPPSRQAKADIKLSECLLVPFYAVCGLWVCGRLLCCQNCVSLMMCSEGEQPPFKAGKGRHQVVRMFAGAVLCCVWPVGDCYVVRIVLV